MNEIGRAVKNAISDHIAHVLNLSETLSYIERLPAASRLVFSYEAQIAKLEEEIERLRGMKLRIYEDLTDGVLDKQEYADFRRQYSDMLTEKNTALELVRRERKDALVYGEAEKVWVTLFRRYENIEAVTRRVLMALVDKILIYEGHIVEVVFRYGDEYRRMSEFVDSHSELLKKSAKAAATDTQTAKGV